MLCLRGLTILLDYGTKKWRSIGMATTTTGVLPVHKATGKPAPNAMTQHKIEPLMRYMNMLGCNTRTTGSVVTIIERADGNDIRPLYYLSAIKFARSPTPTDSEEIAYVAALRLVILALRHLCLPKNCRPLVNQTQQIDFLRPL